MDVLNHNEFSLGIVYLGVTHQGKDSALFWTTLKYLNFQI